MAVYLIAEFDLTDPEAFEEYRPIVVPLLQKHGAEILAADYQPTFLEGDSRRACIVMRFGSESAVMEFYNDPAYQPSLKLRLACTANGSLAIAKEGYTPPPETT